MKWKELDWECVQVTTNSDGNLGHSWQGLCFFKNNTSVFTKNVFWVFLVKNLPDW